MKTILFDWGRTLYNPDTKTLFYDTKRVLEYLYANGYQLVIVSLATAGASVIDERMSIIERGILRSILTQSTLPLQTRTVYMKKRSKSSI